MALKSTLEGLGRRIRQKLCRHCFATGEIKAEHDDGYYTFTHVCVKCGQNFIVKIPKEFIDAEEERDGYESFS